MKAKQYTIRNVPSSVDRALKRKAMEKHTSLNSLLLRALEKEAGVGGESSTHSDLDALIGSWVSDPEVDRALRDSRNMNPRDWDRD